MSRGRDRRRRAEFAVRAACTLCSQRASERRLRARMLAMIRVAAATRSTRAAGREHAREIALAFDDNRSPRWCSANTTKTSRKIERRLGVVANANGNQVDDPRPARKPANRRAGCCRRFMSAPSSARPPTKATSRARSRNARLQGTLFPGEVDGPRDAFEQIAHAPARRRARPQRRAGPLSARAEAPANWCSPKGPAGTGKTWLAVGHAVSLLEQGVVERLDAVAARGRGRRAARLPARRHARQGRSLSAADLRRALRFHGWAHGRARHADRHDRDRAARLHARAHAVQGRDPARRGAERHRRCR